MDGRPWAARFANATRVATLEEGKRGGAEHEDRREVPPAANEVEDVGIRPAEDRAKGALVGCQPPAAEETPRIGATPPPLFKAYEGDAVDRPNSGPASDRFGYPDERNDGGSVGRGGSGAGAGGTDVATAAAL